MEFLYQPSVATSLSTSPICSHQSKPLVGWKGGQLFPQSPLTSTLLHSSFPKHCSQIARKKKTVRMSASVGEEKETLQAREMAAARKRWEALIREQKIKVLTPKEAGYAIQLSNKTLLDVRPSTEHEKAWVKGSTWIPIFKVDNATDAGTISRKVTNFMMGGWWSGVPMLSFDKDFISKVEEKFSKETDLIVACQKGLRSEVVLLISWEHLTGLFLLMRKVDNPKSLKLVSSFLAMGAGGSMFLRSLAACEQLYNSGYRNIFWVQGGLEAAEEEDLQREGPQPFKLAGIGGFSEFLGWTDQQRAWAAKEGWGYRFIFTARLLGLVVLADALFIGAQKLGPFLQQISSH